MNINHLTLLNKHLPKPGNSIPKNKISKTAKYSFDHSDDSLVIFLTLIIGRSILM